MIPSSPSPPTAGRFRIRPAQAADVAPVAAIERAVFADPWSANDFTECLAAGAPFLVAVVGRAVAGYAVAHCAADEGEVLNLGVAQPHRRGCVGVGRRARYYRRPVEDAVILRAAIPAAGVSAKL